MYFRDIIDTAQCIALSDKLHPTEEAVWERYCREFSHRFATPLKEVLAMDPLFVLRQVNSDNLSDFNPEENMESLWEMIYSLQDPDYDAKKEKAIRDELAQIQEREELRLKEGRAIHPSLEKDKRVIVKDQPHQPKELPKSGGVNMALLNRLNNQDNEG